MHRAKQAEQVALRNEVSCVMLSASRVCVCVCLIRTPSLVPTHDLNVCIWSDSCSLSLSLCVYIQEYDTSNPNWEFLQKINDFLSRLPINPLTGDEPVSKEAAFYSTHTIIQAPFLQVVLSKINVCVRKRPLNKKGWAWLSLCSTSKFFSPPQR